jgi:hypothetical protein
MKEIHVRDALDGVLGQFGNERKAIGRTVGVVDDPAVSMVL